MLDLVTIAIFGSILLSPRIGQSVTMAEIIFPLVALLVLAGLKSIRRIVGRGVFYSHFFFAAYCFVISPILYFSLSANPMSLFIFLARVLEIFAFLYVMILIASRRKRTVENIITFFSCVLAAYGGFQVITDSLGGFYGIGLPFEVGSSQGGTVFAMLAVFSFYLLFERRSCLHLFLFLAFLGLTVGTISRTAILGLGFAIIISPMAIFLVRRLSWIRRYYKYAVGTLLIPATVILCLIPTTSFLTKVQDGLVLANKVSKRLARLEVGANDRVQKWKQAINLQKSVSPMTYFTGIGLGIHNWFNGSNTLGFDSMYLRLLFELGIFGSLLWFLTIIFVLLRIYRYSRIKAYFAWMVSTVMFVAGVTHEIFWVTKPALFYYSLLGYFLGSAYYENKKLYGTVTVDGRKISSPAVTEVSTAVSQCSRTKGNSHVTSHA